MISRSPSNPCQKFTIIFFLLHTCGKWFNHITVETSRSRFDSHGYEWTLGWQTHLGTFYLCLCLWTGVNPVQCVLSPSSWGPSVPALNGSLLSTGTDRKCSVLEVEQQCQHVSIQFPLCRLWVEVHWEPPTNSCYNQYFCVGKKACNTYSDLFIQQCA